MARWSRRDECHGAGTRPGAGSTPFGWFAGGGYPDFQCFSRMEASAESARTLHPGTEIRAGRIFGRTLYSAGPLIQAPNWIAVEQTPGGWIGWRRILP